jgi:hypothetical protein
VNGPSEVGRPTFDLMNPHVESVGKAFCDRQIHPKTWTPIHVGTGRTAWLMSRLSYSRAAGNLCL